MNEQKMCPVCGKPVDRGVDHPGADVYHMKCLMDRFEPIRAKMKGLDHGKPTEMEQDIAGKLLFDQEPHVDSVGRKGALE